MGNCISAGSALSRKKLHASPETPCSGNSPLPEEIRKLIPQLMQLSGLKMKPGSTEDRSGKRVKILVTREQLEVLMRNAPALQSLLRKLKKWRPCLDTIPEAEFLIQEIKCASALVLFAVLISLAILRQWRPCRLQPKFSKG